jgi:triacylglycerol lipase
LSSNLKLSNNLLKSNCQLFVLIGIAIALIILLKLLITQNTTQKLIAPCDHNFCSNQVVVLHGLVRSSASMNKISQALNAAGYTVCNLQYPSRKHSIKTIAIDFVLPEIKKCLPNFEQPINFVTHSMGGIIVRELGRSTNLKINRAVMLSPPNHGSELVDKLKVIPLFKLINGEAGLSLGTKANSVPNTLGAVNFETGIIVGDRSYNPIYSYLIPGTDDGKVSIASAKIEGMKDFLIVPHSHSLMMNSDLVIKQIINFIKSGQFY